MNSMSDLPTWRVCNDGYPDTKKQLAALVDFLGFVDTMFMWEATAYASTGRIYIILLGVSKKLWDQMLGERVVTFVKNFPHNQGFLSGKFTSDDFITWEKDEISTVSVFSMRLARLLQDGAI